MKETNYELLAENVNGWLKFYENKKFLIRGQVGEGTTVNMARAFLSDSYNIIDDCKVMEAVQNSIKKADRCIDVNNWEISENRLYLSLSCSRMKDNGITPGFIITNSETGQGAFEIRPKAFIASAGISITMKDLGFRKIHLGSKLKAGEVVRMNEAKVKAVSDQIDEAISLFLSRPHLDLISGAYDQLEKIPLKYPIDSLQNLFKAFSVPEEFRFEMLTLYVHKIKQTAKDMFNAVSLVTPKMEADLRYDIESSLLEFLFKTKNYDKPN